MENAITMTHKFMAAGSCLMVAVINAAINCNVPVADLLNNVL